MGTVKEFNQYRERMNTRILNSDSKILKRIFNLDTNAFNKANLDEKTKELMGLSCSMVLRCDDCVRYHLIQAHKLGVKTPEIMETFEIACLIGGTIVIPHLRRGVEFWDELNLDEPEN